MIFQNTLKNEMKKLRDRFPGQETIDSIKIDIKFESQDEDDEDPDN